MRLKTKVIIISLTTFFVLGFSYMQRKYQVTQFLVAYIFFSIISDGFCVSDSSDGDCRPINANSQIR